MSNAKRGSSKEALIRLESSIARIAVGVLIPICVLAFLESNVLCVEHGGAIPDIQNISCGPRLESSILWVQFSPTGLGSFVGVIEE